MVSSSNEKLGKRAFWFWFVGFFVAFTPLYVLGFMGMMRRMNHYDNPAWQPWLQVAAFGAVLIAIGVAHQVAQVWVSVLRRNQPAYRDITGDPWGGRTLEWATSSPPPGYNFANLPVVHELDAFAHMKETGHGARTGLGLSRHPHAVEHERGFFRRDVQSRAGLRGHLAHLVARDRRARRHCRDRDRLQLPSATTVTTIEASTVRTIEEKRSRALAAVEVS